MPAGRNPTESPACGEGDPRAEPPNRPRTQPLKPPKAQKKSIKTTPPREFFRSGAISALPRRSLWRGRRRRRPRGRPPFGTRLPRRPLGPPPSPRRRRRTPVLFPQRYGNGRGVKNSGGARSKSRRALPKSSPGRRPIPSRVPPVSSPTAPAPFAGLLPPPAGSPISQTPPKRPQKARGGWGEDDMGGG